MGSWGNTQLPYLWKGSYTKMDMHGIQTLVSVLIGGGIFGFIEFFYLLGRKRAAAIITFQLPDFPVKMKWTGACRALIVCNLVRHTNLHNWKTRIPQLYVTAESAKYITIFPV